MVLKIIIFVLLFLYPNLTFAWTKAGNIYTTNGTYADVNSAIQNAITGDTVTIPSGTFGSGQGWTTTLTIQKNIILQGAGGYPTANTTIESTASNVILLNNADASGIRITGIKFNKSSGVMIYISAPLINFRFDHIHFNNSVPVSGGALYIYTNSKTVQLQGVVDNCRFDYGTISIRGLANDMYDWTIYTDPIDLGGPTALYVEDCVAYQWKAAGVQPWNFLDVSYGMAYVSRYNEINGYYHEAHGIQDTRRGTRKLEIYRNTLNGGFDGAFGEYSTYKGQTEATNLRAATAMCFQNEVYNYGGDRTNNYFKFEDYRWAQSRGDCGQCNGASPCDSNYDASGWLCMDQPGSGNDKSLRTAGNPSPDQEQAPIYVWGNTNLGVSHNVVAGAQANYFVADRDYFVQGGAVGMSSGVLASRPTSCTIGQGYWATDQGDWNKATSGDWVGQQGVLYKCTAPNTWRLYYTPYTYPHPLRTVPQGLKIFRRE